MITWVDGIGPPLEQLEEDLEDWVPENQHDFSGKTTLALIAEVKRLRGALEDYADHQSWRCDYRTRYERCLCGLDELTDALGIERVAPADPEAGRNGGAS